MDTLSTSAVRDFAYSGIEHEDEVYSVRQLAARDNDANLVKIEKPLPVLVPADSSAVSTTDSSQVSLNDEEKIPEELNVDDESRSDDRPFAVTASIFRSIDEKNDCKDDSQKDGALPKHAQKEKAFVFLEKALKESLEESIKENDVPATVNQQSFAKKTPFILQVRLYFPKYDLILEFWRFLPRGKLEKLLGIFDCKFNQCNCYYSII